jgi:hypothetical protein
MRPDGKGFVTAGADKMVHANPGNVFFLPLINW